MSITYEYLGSEELSGIQFDHDVDAGSLAVGLESSRASETTEEPFTRLQCQYFVRGVNGSHGLWSLSSVWVVVSMKLAAATSNDLSFEFSLNGYVVI